MVKLETVSVASGAMIWKKGPVYFHLRTMQSLQTSDALNGMEIASAYLAQSIGCLIQMVSVFQSVIFVNLTIKMEPALSAIKDMT